MSEKLSLDDLVKQPHNDTDSSNSIESGSTIFDRAYTQSATQHQSFTQESVSGQDLNAYLNTVDFNVLILEPSLILALAVLIEMFIPISSRFKLIGLMGIFQGLARKVNRTGISERQRAFAGFFLPSLILFILLLLVTILDVISGFDSIVSLIVMIFILELKFPQDHATKVFDALNSKDKERAKNCLHPIVLREVNMLSEIGIAKAAAESAILRIFSGWFAVMFWYLMLGIEGAMLMQTVNILSRAYNYKLRGNYQFGRTIYRVHQALLFVPALILMIILLCSKNPLRHIPYASEAWENYPAKVSGMVLGALGGCLNINLGGPRYYQGNITRLPKVGSPNEPDKYSILYAMRKIRMSGLIFLVFAILLDLNF